METQEQLGESPREAPSVAPRGRLLRRELDEIEEKGLLWRGSRNRTKMGILDHSMTLNQGIDNVAATQAPMSLQPHGMKTLLQIDQVILHHQPFTSRARHESLPSETMWPLGAPKNLLPTRHSTVATDIQASRMPWIRRHHVHPGRLSQDGDMLQQCP